MLPHSRKEVAVMCATKHKHMNLADRCKIEKSLNEHLSFAQIAKSISKDPSTVSKEVRLNLIIINKAGYGHRFNPCIHRDDCSITQLCSSCIHKNKGRFCRFCKMSCFKFCPNFKEEHCPKLDKPPYVCNGCEDFLKCPLRKHLYDASKAFMSYTEKKSVSRQGIIIAQQDIDFLNNLLVPLIKENKQSIHHVYLNHKDEICMSEKTLYKLIDSGYLQVRNIDLPLKVRRRNRKHPSTCKVDSKCRNGRTYEDYKSYMNENPDTSVEEMDSVIGTIGGKVLLTLHFTGCNLMLAFLRDRNDSQSVINVINQLYEVLGEEDFKKLFPLIKTDNGTEFSNPNALEFTIDEQGNKTRRTRIFYCNPSAPYEKGSCEVNHEFIRRILPKGSSFDLLTQEKVDLMMSHINSYGRGKFNGLSPIQIFKTLYGEDILSKLNIQEIQPDDINLSPALVKEATTNER